MIFFDISDVSIFLEPPAELKPEYQDRIALPWINIGLNGVSIGSYGVSEQDIPENFFQDAGKEIGIERDLNNYLKEKHPKIQPIERLNDDLYQEAIGREARTRTMWDCCYSLFDTRVASHARVSLLVEYELCPHARMDDNDCRYLFQECRKLYFAWLTDIQSRQADIPETKARGQAWSMTTKTMLDVYGIPPARIESIARDGSHTWVSEKGTDLVRVPHTNLRSYPHMPRFYFVLPEPKKVKYFMEIRYR